MDEAIGMLSVTAALVLGIWLVDYSGDSSRAAVTMHSSAVEAAHAAAAALHSASADTLELPGEHIAEIAERVVNAAAISDCDTADQLYGVVTDVHQVAGPASPTAVSVAVNCPLSVSSLFARTVDVHVAVPVPEPIPAAP